MAMARISRCAFMSRPPCMARGGAPVKWIARFGSLQPGAADCVLPFRGEWSPMTQRELTDKVCRLGETRRNIPPCSVVILGATGDLTSRKLIPALFQVFLEHQLPPEFRVVGFARRPKTDQE